MLAGKADPSPKLGKGGILLREKLPEANETNKRARDELGAMAGVSGKTYEHTDKVKKLYGDDRQTKADSMKKRQRRRLKLETYET